MPRKLDADDLASAIYELAENSRKATIRDIVSDLQDFMKSGPIDGDEDTWESGFKAAIETITSNYSV